MLKQVAKISKWSHLLFCFFPWRNHNHLHEGERFLFFFLSVPPLFRHFILPPPSVVWRGIIKTRPNNLSPVSLWIIHKLTGMYFVLPQCVNAVSHTHTDLIFHSFLNFRNWNYIWFEWFVFFFKHLCCDFSPLLNACPLHNWILHHLRMGILKDSSVCACSLVLSSPH